jgi:CubicO group peptidase (beta-lactamase class C family)
MKLFFTVIFTLLMMCNKRTAKVEIPNTNEQIGHLVQDVLDYKKSVKIDSFFRTKFKNRSFNGTVLFAENGRIIYKNAYGYSNFRSKQSLTVNSVFQLASVSKPITACAVMLLHEKGKLNLDDDVREFFPEFPYKDITVRLLLTHRSGLPDYMYFVEQYWPSRRMPVTNHDVLDLMILYKPYRYYRPDRRYNYSNTNYCLLALIIEKISGMPFADFMQQQIFEPLGMHHTYVLDHQALKYFDEPQLVAGYAKNGRMAENNYLNGVVGDKGIYSTVEDLLIWDRALYSGKLISLFNLYEALQPAHNDLRDNDNYGFGWRINANGGNPIVFHSGWWRGFKTYFIRKIKEHKTIIVLTNTARNNFISIRRLSELL